MPLYSLLQMEASRSRTTPLKCIKKKKRAGTSLIPRVWKRHAWSSSVILNGHSILWKMRNTELLLKSLNYNTVSQLDQFCRKQGKWVEVTYVLLFISLWDMPDLCPKGTDLGVKPSAPSCSLTLPPVSRDPNWTGWKLGHPSRRGSLSLSRNSNCPDCGQDYFEDPKSTWRSLWS